MIDLREYANLLLQQMADAQSREAEADDEAWRRELLNDSHEREFFEQWLDRSKPCK